METIGIIVIGVGTVMFLIAVAFFLLYRTFEHNEKATDKVMAFLMDVNHKKDVPVYGMHKRGPIHVVMVLKHYSKGLYEYSVGQKRYTIRHAEQATTRQMPRTISVLYLKKFPNIAYVKSNTGMGHEITGIWGIIFFFFGLLFVGNGLFLLL